MKIAITATFNDNPDDTWTLGYVEADTTATLMDKLVELFQQLAVAVDAQYLLDMIQQNTPPQNEAGDEEHQP